MSKNDWVIIFPFLFLFIPLFSCSKLESPNHINKKIAVILKTKDNNYYNELLSGIMKKAREINYNIDVFYSSTEQDWQSQLFKIQNSIDDYDAFILSPNDPGKFITVIKELNKRGKPLVGVADTLFGDFLTLINTDSIVGGQLAAKYAIRHLANKRSLQCVVVVAGNLKSKDHLDRKNIFIETIKSKYRNVKFYTYEAFSDRRMAKKIVVDNIGIINRCPLFYTTNDMMLLGVQDALELLHAQENKVLIGFDGITEVQKEILLGKITATIKQETFSIGEQALDSLHKHFSGVEVPKNILIKPSLILRS
jgi:ribose transport system substrate-binding protein